MPKRKRKLSQSSRKQKRKSLNALAAVFNSFWPREPKGGEVRRKPYEPRLPANNRRCDKPEKTIVTIGVSMDSYQAERLRLLAREANLKISTAVGRLLSFAMEKLLQQKKQRVGNHW
jgi:hypothetical protein